MAAFRETYRGQGIYWHHAARMYGDETLPLYRTIAEYKAAIDAHIAETTAARPEHERYWGNLPHAVREGYRRRCLNTPLSAPELAYSERGL